MIIHKCPPEGSGLTPCCGKTPFELPKTDRMSLNSNEVTCGKHGELGLEDIEGWAGSKGELDAFLHSADADKDPASGKFVIRGDIISYMGDGKDIVIPAGTQYFWKGSPQPLARRLRETGMGLGVNVIA